MLNRYKNRINFRIGLDDFQKSFTGKVKYKKGKQACPPIIH